MGRSVLVTGGTGGLGTAVTSAFLDAGWRVVVPSRSSSPPSSHPRLVPLVADVGTPDGAAAAAALAAAEAGAPLRAVVNLVGAFAMGGLVHETPVEEFERQFAVNVRPTYLVCHATLPHLVAGGGGSIVCLSSRAATHPFPGAAGYVASKAAVLALVDALHAEYAGAGVRVNAVLPGVIDTPTNRTAMPDSNRADWVAPADIARTILFLSSDESHPISNARIPTTHP